MGVARVSLAGTALHGGGPATVALRAEPGPIRWRRRGIEVTSAELVAVGTDRALRVGSSDRRLEIETAEHLLAAFGGLGVRDGVAVETDDDELPLLDGGARRFAEALVAIGASRGRPPALRVVREAVVRRGACLYRFRPADAVALEVEVRFRAPVGAERATWHGDPDDFLARIAPARTFGWLDEAHALRRRGLARGATFESVLVFGADGVVLGGRPAEPGEAARHKLLDLVGDLALYGGPPRGELCAFAPGHASTHAVVAEALAAGVLTSGA